MTIDELQISGITVDNASNNDTFVCELQENGECACDELNGIHMCDFSEELEQHESKLKVKTHHFRCMGHVLNLGAKAALKKCEAEIANLREILKRIRKTPSVSSTIWKEGDLKVILDCCTRWNSTYDMLMRAVQLKKVPPVKISDDSRI
jgi:hypothetical protein